MKIKIKFLSLFFLTLFLSNSFVATNLFSMKRKEKCCSRLRDMGSNLYNFISKKLKKDPNLTNPIENVPDEIWLEILGYLEPQSFASFACTCKYFNDVLDFARIRELKLPNNFNIEKAVKTGGCIALVKKYLQEIDRTDSWNSEEVIEQINEAFIRAYEFCDLEIIKILLSHDKVIKLISLEIVEMAFNYILGLSYSCEFDNEELENFKTNLLKLLLSCEGILFKLRCSDSIKFREIFNKGLIKNAQANRINVFNILLEHSVTRKFIPFFSVGVLRHAFVCAVQNRSVEIVMIFLQNKNLISLPDNNSSYEFRMKFLNYVNGNYGVFSEIAEFYECEESEEILRLFLKDKCMMNFVNREGINWFLKNILKNIAINRWMENFISLANFFRIFISNKKILELISSDLSINSFLIEVINEFLSCPMIKSNNNACEYFLELKNKFFFE